MLKKSIFLCLALAMPAFADAPVVQNVKATRSGELWNFDVTVKHTDYGWEDYVDQWRILGPDGKELGLRNLAHPHVDEQPLTRSLSGVSIPDGVTEVGVQAHETVGGWTSEVKKVKLP